MNQPAAVSATEIARRAALRARRDRRDHVLRRLSIASWVVAGVFLLASIIGAGLLGHSAMIGFVYLDGPCVVAAIMLRHARGSRRWEHDEPSESAGPHTATPPSP